LAVGDRDVPVANRVETKNWWCHPVRNGNEYAVLAQHKIILNVHCNYIQCSLLMSVSGPVKWRQIHSKRCIKI